MSIVALKRKSDIINSSISRNNQFSINGGYRNQGWIGQDSRGRYLSRTPFRGPLPMGHGEKNNSYNISITNGGKRQSNNSNIIKPSIKNLNLNKCYNNCTPEITVKNFPYNNTSLSYNDMSQSSNVNKIKSFIHYENILSKCNNNEIEINNNIGAGGSAGAGATSYRGYKTNCNDCRTLYKSKTLIHKSIQPLTQNEYISKNKSVNLSIRDNIC